MKINFTKMQGLGNDFVIIDSALQNNVGLTTVLTPAVIRAIADRHFGIGCDQVILLSAPKDSEVDVYYRIFNADGSEAGQSGNGARCVAKYVYEHGLAGKRVITMQTFARTTKATIEDDDQVIVDMGVVELLPSKIPFLANEQALNYEIASEHGIFTVGAISVGNPHAVLQVRSVEQVDVLTIGRSLSVHPYFPEGANINFMQIIDKNHIKLRTYERGSGETLACGSGATASVAIGRLWELLSPQVTVYLQGGILVVNCSGEGLPVSVVGAAKLVFTGLWNIDVG